MTEPKASSVTVRVMVVDDQPAFRLAARTVLSRLPEFVLVGEAETGEEAVDLADSVHPTLVLMDINLPGIDGIEAARRITADHDEVAVLLVSTYPAEDLPEAAGACGAFGYLRKEELRPARLQELWAALERPARASPPNSTG